MPLNGHRPFFMNCRAGSSVTWPAAFLAAQAGTRPLAAFEDTNETISCITGGGFKASFFAKKVIYKGEIYHYNFCSVVTPVATNNGPQGGSGK